MVSSKTELALQRATECELENCTARYGERYNTLHEAESVLREELEETQEALNKAMELFLEMHSQMRLNAFLSDVLKTVQELRKNIFHATEESVQAAAVCDKLLRGTKS